MQRVTGGGLCGKARRTHKMSRAARLHSRQLIMDYLEPEPDPADRLRDRAIPVRRNVRSRPAATPTFEHVATGESQLELPLGAPEPSAESAVCLIPARKLDSTPRTHRAPCKPDRPRPATGVRRGRTDPRRPTGKSTTRFSLRGFLCGCALGGAAAAGLLLVVRAALA